MNAIEIKEQLFTACTKFIDEAIGAIEKAIEVANSTASEETKSSAGDKYETGRARSYHEVTMYVQQLEQLLISKRGLATLFPLPHCTAVKGGALVESSIGWFFFALSADEVEIEGEIYTTLSLASPLGKVMEGHTAGETVTFRGQSIIIHSVA